MTRRMAVVFTVVMALGCGRSGDAAGILGSTALAASRVQVQTLGTEFDRPAPGTFASVPFRVTNRSTAPVFVARCGDRLMATVEGWDGRGWASYSGDVCAAVHPMDPVPLAAGVKREAARAIGEPGLFRLRLGLATQVGAELQPVALSNAFRVR